MSAHTYQVKGSTLRTKLGFARERFGEAAVDALEAELAAHGIARVLEGSWYDFALYDALLSRLAEVAYEGDIERLREAGAYSASQALSSTYQAFARKQDLHHFLDLMPQFHTRLHSLGTLSIDARSDQGFVLTLRDVPQHSEADAYVTEGFYVACAEHLGCTNVRCDRSRQGNAVRYEIHHDPRADGS